MSIPYGKIVDQNNLLSIDIHVLTDKIRLNTRKQKKKTDVVFIRLLIANYSFLGKKMFYKYI